MSNYEFWKELENIFEAVTAYQKKNIEFNRIFISPWIQLGHTFPHETTLQDKLQTALHAAELDPQNSQIWLELGDLFLKLGNMKESADSYRKAIALDPKAAWPKSNLAYVMAAEARYPEAIELYTECLQLFTDDHDRALTWNRLGEVYRKMGDFSKAVAAFRKADELEFSHPHPGKPMEPRLEAESGVSNSDSKSKPESNQEPLNGKPDALEVTKGSLPGSRVDKADEPNSQSDSSHGKRAEDWGDSVSAFERLLLLKMEQKQDGFTGEQASSPELETRIEARSFNPSPILENDVEVKSQKEGSYADSEAAPISPVTRTGGQDEILMEMSSHVALKEDTSNESTVSPSSISAGNNTNDAPALNQPSVDEAVFEKYMEDPFQSGKAQRTEMEEKATVHPSHTTASSSEEINIPEYNSQDPQVWNELGNVYFNSGMFDSAILAYKQAIELDPHFALAYSNLALAYAQKDNFTEAVLLYKQSIKLSQDPKDKAAAWNRLGNLYRHHHQYEEAIAAYQTADDLDPESVSLALRSRFSLLGDLPVEEPAYI